MKISIDNRVFRKFPKLKIVFLLVKDIDNKKHLEDSQHLLTDIEEYIKLTFHKEELKNHYLISPWAVAQEEFGKKAQHYHTSVERLLKAVLKNRSVKAKDSLTNLVRYLALKEIIPFGVDDFSKISGDLKFSLSTGKERVNLLKTIKEKALYYQDKESVLGTHLDFWRSKKTALTPNSSSALIHLMILPPLTQKKMGKTLQEVQDLIQSFCGGKIKVFSLSKGKPSVKI